MTAYDLRVYEGDKQINTSDMIELRDQAQEELQSLVDAVDEAEWELEKADLQREVNLWNEENHNIFTDLNRVCDELPPDETMVHDNVIDDYLESMVNDCYDLPKDLPSFISLQIDYDALKQDYTTVEYGGATYWVRYS